MPVPYALFQNNLTTDPDDYAAVVKTVASAGLDSVVNRMVERGSTITRADILAVLEDAIGASESMLLDGMRVNFGGLVELYPRIRGIFAGPTDAFDPARHALDVGANPGIRIRNTVRDQGSVTKIEAIKPAPNPTELRDVGSATTNNQLTPGNIGQLSGGRLKFDDQAEDEGVYLVAALGGETKVDTVQKNKPGQVVFLVPTSLAPGQYSLELRARIAGGTQLRTGRLDATLTVS